MFFIFKYHYDNTEIIPEDLSLKITIKIVQ
jgi:hypothetical protein